VLKARGTHVSPRSVRRSNSYPQRSLRLVASALVLQISSSRLSVLTGPFFFGKVSFFLGQAPKQRISSSPFVVLSDRGSHVTTSTFPTKNRGRLSQVRLNGDEIDSTPEAHPLASSCATFDPHGFCVVVDGRLPPCLIQPGRFRRSSNLIPIGRRELSVPASTCDGVRRFLGSAPLKVVLAASRIPFPLQRVDTSPSSPPLIHSPTVPFNWPSFPYARNLPPPIPLVPLGRHPFRCVVFAHRSRQRNSRLRTLGPLFLHRTFRVEFPSYVAIKLLPHEPPH